MKKRTVNIILFSSNCGTCCLWRKKSRTLVNLSKQLLLGQIQKGKLVYQVDTQELVKEFLVANPKADAKTEAEVRVAATKVKVTPSKTEDYQNNDEITFTFASDKDAEKYFKSSKRNKSESQRIKRSEEING